MHGLTPKKFLLNDQGEIDRSTFVSLHNRAAHGPTKLKIGEVKIGEWGTQEVPAGLGFLTAAVPIPPFDLKTFPDEPSETNRHNEKVTISQSGDEVSSFATARIGERGRRVSFRQFGKDAP